MSLSFKMSDLKNDKTAKLKDLDQKGLEDFKEILAFVFASSAFQVDIREDGFVDAVINRYGHMTAQQVLTAIHMGVTGQLIQVYGGIVRQDTILARDGFMSEFNQINTSKMPWV